MSPNDGLQEAFRKFKLSADIKKSSEVPADSTFVQIKAIVHKLRASAWKTRANNENNNKARGTGSDLCTHVYIYRQSCDNFMRLVMKLIPRRNVKYMQNDIV